MRVVGGIAKGRQLKGPAGPGTRPVMDRVKTALFDILAPEIVETRFLDLFAGTGSIGIEALSRGATSATFIENSADAMRIVRQNLTTTRLTDRAETLRTDAFAFLQQARRERRTYDIVYVAPPQYVGLASRALAQLDAAPLTEPGGAVIVQIDPRERNEMASVPLSTLALADERRYGSTLLLFFDHPEAESTGTPAAAEPESLDHREQIRLSR